jgi:hypothetical protein
MTQLEAAPTLRCGIAGWHSASVAAVSKISRSGGKRRLSLHKNTLP